MVYPSTYENMALDSLSESLRKRFAMDATPDKKPSTMATRNNNNSIGRDRYTLKEIIGEMHEGAENKVRTIDAIIVEESSKNSFYP